MSGTFLAVIKDSKIELIDSVALPEGAKLLVTLLPGDSLSNLSQDWRNISLQGLENAYDENEPEYPLELVKELNPEYEGREYCSNSYQSI
jgi:hypothetical protein